MDIKKILPNYFAILEKKKLPKFKEAKQKGLLSQKIKEAYKIFARCELCERKCHINRYKEKGWCQLQDKMLVSSWFDHYGEEPFLVPSFAIFFWSCTFSCQYCQNWGISQRYEKPQEIDPKKLASIIDKHSYCKNVNFVGGEPTPHLPFILKTLSFVKSNLPVVWNSNFYMSRTSMNLLKGIIDVYLTDFKYGNDRCALRLSKVNNYTAIVKRNHLLAQDSEVVIRHLVMPNHIKCCSKPILKWISENLKMALLNIMDQYRPEFQAFKFEEINRNLDRGEFQEIINYAKELRLNFIC